MLRKWLGRRRNWGLLILAVALLGSARWWPGWYWSWRSDNPVRRGAKLAAQEGCLSCHDPSSSQEFQNPGSRWGTVPSFFRGNAMMYVKSPSDVAYFIAEGHAPGSSKRSGDARTAQQPPFEMKAFKGRLTTAQIEDLASFVLAADGFEVPSEGPVAKGSELSLKFGCESCHGAGGCGGVPNPRSFTGTVPGWTGPDFKDLVRTQGEFREWVQKGRSERMAANRAAAFFLDRANLQMPAFQGAMGDKDISDLWAYVQWRRSKPGAPATQTR